MNTTPVRLPIKPRFFLRRWADRKVVDIHARISKIPMKGAAYQNLGLIPVFLVALPLLLIMGGCLTGIFYPSGWIWVDRYFWAAAITWPARWALRPWVVPRDDDTVRALTWVEYKYIQDHSSEAYLDKLVEWAVQDHYFDTRHLRACIKDNDCTCPKRSIFNGHTALDLFDGLVGRRVEAMKQSAEFESSTPKLETLLSASRRL